MSDVPALDRGLDVLEHVAGAAAPLSLAQIARAAGLTVSEVQRTVTRLTRRSYLVRDERGCYRLSTRLFRLATEHPPFRYLIAYAMPAMQRYTEVTGESVQLAVLSSDLLLLVAQVEGHGLLRLSLRLGAAQDPIREVSGRVLLAGQDRDELMHFIERLKLPAREAERLRQACNAIRERGYESGLSSHVEGVHQVAVPVRAPDGRLVAALMTSFLLPGFDETPTLEHLDLMHRTALAIGQAFEPTPGRGQLTRSYRDAK